MVIVITKTVIVLIFLKVVVVNIHRHHRRYCYYRHTASTLCYFQSYYNPAFSEGADSVYRQMRGSNECPFSGVTSFNWQSLEDG